MTDFVIKVKSITVVEMRGGSDRVLITLEPDSWPALFELDPTAGYVIDAAPHFTVQVQNGYGAAWAKETFPGVNVEVAKAR